MATNKNKQLNQVSFANPPATAASTALQGLVDKGGDFATPIRSAYARAEQDYNRSFKNPLGSFTTADVRDKSVRANHNAMGQAKGNALADAAQQNADSTFNRQATVANLTAPRLYNSSSSQPFTAGDGLSLAASGLSGFLT